MINPRRRSTITANPTPPEIRLGNVYRLRSRDERWIAWDYDGDVVKFVAIGSPFQVGVSDMAEVDSLVFTMHTLYAQEAWERLAEARGVA